MQAIGRSGLIGLFVVAITGGCSGTSTAQTIRADDLQRIVAVQPEMPGWDWPSEPLPRPDPPPSETPSSSERPPDTSDPLTAELERQFAVAGGIVAADGSRWQDDAKLGATFALLLKDSAGAGIALAAERDFQHGWAERDGGKVTDLPIDGLGDEAWEVVVTESPIGQEATYAWRLNSLVMMVHVQCIFRICPSDISVAVREWVDVIDDEAAAAIADAASRP